MTPLIGQSCVESIHTGRGLETDEAVNGSMLRGAGLGSGSRRYTGTNMWSCELTGGSIVFGAG
jgi:hypothetical protein